jgi:arsenate reductase
MPRPVILFLCTGNSCRSQMAEGWLRHLARDRYTARSAGARPAGFVHPLAIKVMAEAGVDISRQWSKSIDDFAGRSLDLLVTVCSRAQESCPAFAGARRQVHWGFDDPAHASGNEATKLAAFRRVRDEIRQRIERFLREEPEPPKNGRE